jgi:hypothetical protein
MADRVRLHQVFMNLMLNGIDATKGATARELTIKSEAGDGQLLISVSDTSVGLSPEQAEQIFQTFFTTKDIGTGMGLPISRSIIESHGGPLWATGASGRGATFNSSCLLRLRRTRCAQVANLCSLYVLSHTVSTCQSTRPARFAGQYLFGVWDDASIRLHSLHTPTKPQFSLELVSPAQP